MKGMKIFKNLKALVLSLTVCVTLFAFCFAVLCACSDKNTSEEKKEGFTLNLSQKELIVGESFDIIPENAMGKIVYQSRKNTVATVTETGTVTAHSVGATVIEVSDGTTELECKITVSESSAPTIKLDVASTTLYAGLTRSVYARVTASGEEAATQPTFIYESGNESVFTVSPEGVVLGVDKGNATLTVKAEYDGAMLTASKQFTVAELCVLIVPEQIEIALRGNDTSEKLSAQVNLDGNLLTDPDGLTWSVADEGIASYNAETNVLTAVKRGETTVTVSFNGVEETVLVKVDNLPFVNEINSFADADKYAEGVEVSSPGFSGASADAQYYTDGAVGGRMPYGEGFVKTRHLVPPATRVDQWIRGERLQVTIKCLNNLRALRDAGYTDIIVPVYFTFDEKTSQEYLPLWNRNYTVSERLYPETWTYYVYPIEEAVKDVTENDELYFYVFNYSGDYTDLLNVDITVYFDSIFAVKGSAEVSVTYEGRPKTHAACFEKGETLRAASLAVSGIPETVAYETFFVKKDGSSISLKDTGEIKLDETGSYTILVESELSSEYSYRKSLSVLVVEGEIAENEINSLANETRVNENVWASVEGIAGYSTATFSYHKQAVGGRTPTGAGFIKASHIVPGLEYTEPWMRGERLCIRIRCFNDLWELKEKGYTTVVIPAYFTFDEVTKETSLIAIPGGVWGAGNVSVTAKTWTNIEYSIDALLADSTDGVLTLHFANWSADYAEKINVGISVYVDAIYAK